MVPLPGFFVDALTGPLKQHISEIAEQILYFAGYPIARTGVMLTIGQYQLLVADACSGLHTMFSLSALGLLFMYLTARRSLLHNLIILTAILPIAFIANIIRVLVLMLITYHFGDAAGQGYLHGAAGIILLVTALVVLLMLDAILARVIKPRKSG
jgi:exosortase